MSHRHSTQVAAIALSLLATMATLGGMNSLAVQPHQATGYAQAAEPQVIVVVGKRLAHS